MPLHTSMWAALLGLLPTLEGAKVFSARCSTSPTPLCSLSRGADPEADATGSFEDSTNTTGWAQLLIKTRSSSPGTAAFAAGYLEGALTADRVAQHLRNVRAGQHLDPLPAGTQDFIEATDTWAQKQMAAAKPTDEYWNTVRFVYGQLDGLLAGVNDHLSPEWNRLTRLDLLTLNMVWDLEDIKQAVNIEQRVNFENMSTMALSLYIRQRSHCSSVVKLVADGSELFAGHNTWMGYHFMLRVFKRYEFGDSAPIAMPSYPGVLSSTDDFYQVGKLVVMETTLPSYNNEVLAAVRPQTLPFWIRAMVANRLAGSGSEWMEVFKKHNSGTYNNMWMVVDYSRFTPGKPLPEGVLTVGEQVPGYFHYEDQTKVLSYGYWPSYNQALYPETVRLVKQDLMVKQRGPEFSYEFAPRAQIFRRDQAGISTDEDMQRVMRYNQFQRDPLAKGDPCNQLACRADLGAGLAQKAFGAIDAKYTSLAHVQAGRTLVVSGPTHDDQPAFDWAAAPSLAASTSHLGQPERFDFGWQVMGPGMEATPWGAPVGPTANEQATFAAVAVAGTIAAAASVSLLVWRRWQNEGLDKLESYKALDAETGGSLLAGH